MPWPKGKKFSPEHIAKRSASLVNMARQRAKLNDSYVRRMLAQEIGLRCKDIPQPLVEAQRELLNA